MRLAMHLPQYGRLGGPEAVSRVAVAAEALGFSGVFVSDHIVQPADQSYPSPRLFDPLVTLTWAAALAREVDLGTSVLVVPQHNPLELANSLASLDALSGGRVIAGVGTGWSEGEYAALGYSFGDRGRRLDETLRVWRSVWEDDPATFRGEFTQFDALRVLPQPAHRIPVWVGGAGERVWRRAVEHGDGLHLIAVTPEAAVAPITRVRADRPEPEFVISLRTGWDPQGMEPDLIRAEMDAYREAGVTYVVCAPWRRTIDDWLASMEQLASIGRPHTPREHTVTKPTPFDEQFVHQLPELLPVVAVHHPFWRESLFFDIHDPAGTPDDDVLFLTLAHYPARAHLDSLQMGRVGGEQVFGLQDRAADGDPHTLAVRGVNIEVVRPWEEVHLFADPEITAIGMDLTFHARTQPYGLRRGTMRAGADIVWDQCHIFQSGTYTGSYTAAGATREIEGWIGQRDHSWGIRDHGRCPLWLWFQLQLEDGFLGVWHWELANGARIYTDGCWAGADGRDPIPIVDFHHEMTWIRADGQPAHYGEHGEDATGLTGTCRFELADGRAITVEASGTFARPYEPFQRGGLNLMTVQTDDGRAGTAIYEVTGSRHHHYFPDTIVSGVLPY